MNKYLVTLTTDASLTIEIEAESVADAYHLACDQAPSLCWSQAVIDMSDYWEASNVVKLDENGGSK